MPLSFSVPTSLQVAGTLTVTGATTLSATTSALARVDASGVVSTTTLQSNFSLAAGTLSLAAALTSINSVTSVAGQNLVLAVGTGGTGLTITSSTLLATFAGVLAVSSTEDASTADGTTGAVRSLGGLSVAKKGYFGGGLFVTAAEAAIGSSITAPAAGVGTGSGINTGLVLSFSNKSSSLSRALKIDSSVVDGATLSSHSVLWVSNPTKGTGVITDAIGLNLLSLTAGSQNNYAAYINPMSGAATAGNYGVYIGNISGAAVNNYAIYTGTGIVRFGDTLVLDKSSNALRITNSQTPASATATGTAGTICWDTSFLYVCTATDTWRRISVGAGGW